MKIHLKALFIQEFVKDISQEKKFIISIFSKFDF